MSFGKMNGFADLIRVEKVKDKEGFVSDSDVILASLRVYQEGRHGSTKWANLSTFSVATDLFRFRYIPDLTIEIGDFLVNESGRYEITSVENVKGKGMYIEVLAKKVEGENG